MSRATSIRLLFAAVVLLATALPVADASGSTRTTQKLTVYAVPATVQFMNHADDRLRGMSSNPFNLKAQTLIFNDNGKEKGNGPFPGDDILYAFKLFADAKRTQPTGTAIFTCYYGFGKRATCDSYFDLAKGLLLASGQVPFGQTHFTLGVTGGTHAYLGALGQLELRAGCQERTAVRPPGDELQMTGRRMSRRLPAALVAVARRCDRRGSGRTGHDAGTPVVRLLRQADASAVHQPCRRSRTRELHESVRGRASHTEERELREAGGAGRRQRALHPQAVFRRQAHATRRHRGVLLHGQLRPASDLRGPVRAQRRGP